MLQPQTKAEFHKGTQRTKKNCYNLKIYSRNVKLNEDLEDKGE